MTAVCDPDLDSTVRGPFEPYIECVEPMVEASTPADPATEPREPVLSMVADVVDPAALTMVDYASIATIGQLPVVNKQHGVAWYIGQRGLSYFPLITREALTIHSFDWRSVAVKTPAFPTVQVNAVVLAGCGTPCIPIPEHEELPAHVPIAYCTNPRCWKQPESQSTSGSASEVDR